MKEITVTLFEEEMLLLRRGGCVEKEQYGVRVRVLGKHLNPPGPVINRDVLDAVRMAKRQVGTLRGPGYAREVAERALKLYEHPGMSEAQKIRFLEIAERYAHAP